MKSKSFTRTASCDGIPDTIYKRLEKHAHRLWNIKNDDGELLVERTGAELDVSDKDIISVGDRASVFVGGACLTGRVASMRFGEIGIDTKDGLEYYPMGWVLKAQTAPQQPAQPGQQPTQPKQAPKRTKTRDDLVPMTQQELTPDQQAVSEYIRNTVAQRGQVIFRMDPSGADDSDPILTVTPQGNGFKAVQTAKVQKTIFQNTYPTIEAMVGALQLNHMPQESSVTKPVTRVEPTKRQVRNPKYNPE